MKSFPLLSSISFLLLLLFSSSAKAKPFICKSAPTATCQSRAGYVPANSTTLNDIQSLFNVSSFASLLGANNLSLSTPPSHPISAGKTVFIPFPCKCSNGSGISDRTPIYTVKSTDTGLDDIARNTFDLFVTFQDIADVNRIKDVNIITKGEKLWIPLPCSCDPVEGEKVVHLAHLVAKGSSVEAIAKQFGTTETVLQNLNGISDPTKLQAGQVLDVPLKVGSAGPAPQPAAGNSPPSGSPSGTQQPAAGNSPPSGSSAGRLRQQGNQIKLLFIIQVAVFLFSFLA